MTDLSPTMQDALAHAECGLHRWPGGYWTDKPVSEAHKFPRGVPDWYVSAHTVQALLRRRELVIVERARQGFPVIVVPPHVLDFHGKLPAGYYQEPRS